MPRRRALNGALTELEGAVLSVIQRGGACTPYRVRQDFLTSRSREWSGSAGAVYPALRRLQSAGLLRAKETKDARNSVLYSLSKAGRAALADWLSDVVRATGSGLDPFRCRADLWEILPKGRQAKLARDMLHTLNEKCEALAILSDADGEPERIAARLELELHKTRVQWLKKQYGA